MFKCVFDFFTLIDGFFWSYLGFALVALLGGYFTLKTGLFQIRAFPSLVKTFSHFIVTKQSAGPGTHPIKVFFASVGGMIGIGNIVGICTALQIGGPGAIFWVWVAAFLGSLIKYSEVFLGFKYRIPNKKGGFDGGPMYFLQKAFNVRWIGTFICILMCVYGAEIYQFSVLAHTISSNWNLNHLSVVLFLLVIILYAAVGGINRVGKICTLIMPFFTCVYLAMGCWFIGHHALELPSLLKEVFKAAFTGQSALGGFVGGSLILAIQQGISRAVYSSDVGIGYDSIIQSESSATQPLVQARLSMLGVFLDNIVCTFSLLVALCSGLWITTEPCLIVQTALSSHFPHMPIFMPIFLFILAYSTLISYLMVGFKCARFLHPRLGEKAYLFFATTAFITFSFFDPSSALLVMSISGCLLLCTNLLGIFRLRKEILFHAEKPNTTPYPYK